MTTPPKRPPPFYATPVCIVVTIVGAINLLLQFHHPVYGVPPLFVILKAWQGNANLKTYQAWEQGELLAGRPVPARKGWQEKKAIMFDGPVNATVTWFGITIWLVTVCSFVSAIALSLVWGIFLGWLWLTAAVSFVFLIVVMIIFDARTRKRLAAAAP